MPMRVPAQKTPALAFLLFVLGALLIGWLFGALPVHAAPQEVGGVEYRTFPVLASRVAVSVIAQPHLMSAAFVLAVPMFALIIEFIGYGATDDRYDDLAYEVTRLLSVSFSSTATLGALLTFALFILYPRLMEY